MLDQLRDTVAHGGLAISRDDSAIMADGRPAPMSGKYFYAVHQGSRTNNWLGGDESTFSALVTITARANEPFDRIGPELVDLIDGLDDKADAVWTCFFAHQWTGQIPGTIGVMTRANTYLENWGATYGWTEALYPSVMSDPTPVQAEWLIATGREPHKVGTAWSKTGAFAGVIVEIRFVGANRLMNNADAGA